MKTIGQELFAELSEKAAASPRKRSHFNLHKSLEDDIHRLCIAAEPGTYVRPHRHSRKDAWELLIVLKGAVDILVFEDDGTLRMRTALSESGSNRAIELDEGTLHCFIPRKSSVVMEVKRGPYLPIPEADFGPWAPPEGNAKAPSFLETLDVLMPGEKAF